MAPRVGRDAHRLPDLTSLKPTAPQPPSGIEQVKLQSEQLAQAAASAQVACSALRTYAADLTAALAQAATALQDWQTVAFVEAGADKGCSSPAKLGEEHPWAASVIGAQTLATHLAALQAETIELSSSLTNVVVTQGELGAELQRWVHTVPREALSYQAVDILNKTPAAPQPLGGDSVVLRNLAERHQNAVPLPALSATPSPILQQGFGFGASRVSLDKSLATTMGSHDKKSWACTAARLDGERTFKAGRGRHNRSTASTRAFGNTTTLSTSSSYPTLPSSMSQPTLRRSSFFDTSGDLSMMSSNSEYELVDAELNSTKAALAEAKAEINVLRSRFRDRAAPVVLRMPFHPPPVTEAGIAKSQADSAPSRQQPAATGESALICTKMTVPSTEPAAVRKDEDDLELRQLRYQLEDNEKELSRARRFYTRKCEELTDKNKEIEDLKEACRKLRVDMQEQFDSGLKAYDEGMIARELKERGFDFSKYCQLSHAVEHAARDASKSVPGSRTSLAPQKPRETPAVSPRMPNASDSNQGGPVGGLSIGGLGFDQPPRSARTEAVQVQPPQSATSVELAAPTVAVKEVDVPASSKASSSTTAPNKPGGETTQKKDSLKPWIPAGAQQSATNASPRTPRRRMSSNAPSAVAAEAKRAADGKSKKKRVKELWNCAKEYVRRLAKIGGDKAHVELQLEDLYEKFRPEFENSTVGLYEFVGRHAREEEFDRLVQELVDQGSTAKGVTREHSVSNLKALEREMAAGYNRAFDEAGGQMEAEKYFEETNLLLRRLRTKIGARQFRQDAGYQILGLDKLYDLVRHADPKLGQEVDRIGQATGGHVYHAKLKGRIRARAKTLTKYGNNASYLTDVMRASVVYDSIKELYQALTFILEEDLDNDRYDFAIIEVTDRFQNPKDGYRDISMLVEVDGVIGEVQLHLKHIKNAKSSAGHDAYKQQRLINESLFEACVRGNVDDILALAKRYRCCAFGVKDKNGRAALHYACQVGSALAARVLIQYKADPWDVDANGVLPLEVALRAGCGSFRTAKKRRKAIHNTCFNCGSASVKPYDYCGGARCKQKPMIPDDDDTEAIIMHYDVVRFMLAAMMKSEEDVGNGPRRIVRVVIPWLVDHIVHTSKHKSKKWLNVWLEIGRSLIKLVRRYSSRNSKLFQSGRMQSERDELYEWMLSAAAKGNADRVKVLLEVGFDEKPKPKEPSVLDLGIENGQEELAIILLNLPKPAKGLYAAECNRCPLHRHLHHAARTENPEYAIAALAAKANPNHELATMPQRRTPLMAFAASGNLEMCKKLVEYQAQVDWHDNLGCGAVHYALAHNHSPIEEYLQSIKQVVELPRFDDHTIDYLLMASEYGCSGAVWRFVNKNMALAISGGAGDESDPFVTEVEDPPADEHGRPRPPAIMQETIKPGLEGHMESLFKQTVATKGDAIRDVSNYKITPLHVAVRSSRKHDPAGQVSRALMLAKADPTWTTSHGDTALHLAAEIGNLRLYNDVLAHVTDQHHPGFAEELQLHENAWGQKPRHLLQRSLARDNMRNLNYEDKTEEDVLKGTVLLAFRHNMLNERLLVIRENKAMTWFEAIRSHRGNLKEDIDEIHLNRSITPLSPHATFHMEATADELVNFFSAGHIEPSKKGAAASRKAPFAKLADSIASAQVNSRSLQAVGQRIMQGRRLRAMLSISAVD